MTNNAFDDILTYSRARTDRFNAATATIESLTIDPAPSTDPYRPSTRFDDADAALRILLIDPDELELDDFELIDAATIDALRIALAELRALADADRSDAREYLTQLALDQSLCPLHFLDYAICFDDDDDECAAIRAIHPTHDT